jgi:hypothetical protein
VPSADGYDEEQLAEIALLGELGELGGLAGMAPDVVRLQGLDGLFTATDRPTQTPARPRADRKDPLAGTPANELGYADRGTVHRIVARALGSHLAEGVEHLGQVEVARLDALQAGLWEAALAGDAAATTACVKIVQARSRLLGMYGQAPAASSPAHERARYRVDGGAG